MLVIKWRFLPQQLSYDLNNYLKNLNTFNLISYYSCMIVILGIP